MITVQPFDGNGLRCGYDDTRPVIYRVRLREEGRRQPLHLEARVCRHHLKAALRDLAATAQGAR